MREIECFIDKNIEEIKIVEGYGNNISFNNIKFKQDTVNVYLTYKMYKELHSNMRLFDNYCKHLWSLSVKYNLYFFIAPGGDDAYFFDKIISKPLNNTVEIIEEKFKHFHNHVGKIFKDLNISKETLNMLFGYRCIWVSDFLLFIDVFEMIAQSKASDSHMEVPHELQ